MNGADVEAVRKCADDVVGFLSGKDTPTNIALMGCIELAIRIVRAEQQLEAPEACEFLRRVLSEIARGERAAAGKAGAH